MRRITRGMRIWTRRPCTDDLLSTSIFGRRKDHRIKATTTFSRLKPTPTSYVHTSYIRHHIHFNAEFPQEYVRAWPEQANATRDLDLMEYERRQREVVYICAQLGRDVRAAKEAARLKAERADVSRRWRRHIRHYQIPRTAPGPRVVVKRWAYLIYRLRRRGRGL